jgi:hypothetical protein
MCLGWIVPPSNLPSLEQLRDNVDAMFNEQFAQNQVVNAAIKELFRRGSSAE